MSVCLLIPAYNEARTIGQVVSDARKIIDSVVVIDDGSQDATAQIAQDSGALTLRHQVNRGKGAALRTGFQYVLDHGYDAAITMDSDGQHDVDDIPRFLEAFNEKGSGVILGSRMHDISTMPLHRRCSNTLTSLVISIRVGCRIPDSQSGFRWIRSSVLRAIPLKDDGYHLESELLIKAGKKGVRISAVPIDTIYRNEESSIKPFGDTIRFIVLIIRSFFWM